MMKRNFGISQLQHYAWRKTMANNSKKAAIECQTRWLLPIYHEWKYLKTDSCFILIVVLGRCNMSQLILALTACPSMKFDVVSACCDSNIITIIGCQAVNSVTQLIFQSLLARNFIAPFVSVKPCKSMSDQADWNWVCSYLRQERHRNWSCHRHCW